MAGKVRLGPEGKINSLFCLGSFPFSMELMVPQRSK